MKKLVKVVKAVRKSTASTFAARAHWRVSSDGARHVYWHAGAEVAYSRAETSSPMEVKIDIGAALKLFGSAKDAYFCVDDPAAPMMTATISIGAVQHTIPCQCVDIDALETRTPQTEIYSLPLHDVLACAVVGIASAVTDYKYTDGVSLTECGRIAATDGHVLFCVPAAIAGIPQHICKQPILSHVAAQALRVIVAEFEDVEVAVDIEGTTIRATEPQTGDRIEAWFQRSTEDALTDYAIDCVTRQLSAQRRVRFDVAALSAALKPALRSAVAVSLEVLPNSGKCTLCAYDPESESAPKTTTACACAVIEPGDPEHEGIRVILGHELLAQMLTAARETQARTIDWSACGPETVQSWQLLNDLGETIMDCWLMPMRVN